MTEVLEKKWDVNEEEAQKENSFKKQQKTMTSNPREFL